MKTETIHGKEVLRVDGPAWACAMENKGTKLLRCAFLTDRQNCSAYDENKGTPCKWEHTIFIRPDQLNDYLALKLVT
jgi:hypothetical protein